MTVLWVLVVVELIAIGYLWTRLRILLKWVKEVTVWAGEVTKLSIQNTHLIRMMGGADAHNWQAFADWQATTQADIRELQQRMDS